MGQQETEEFAALLRQLKDRSGLSYGTLARRLHLSPSSLHRYTNGDAVPQDYAAVERFARLCRATPDELLEAHRRWMRADATRARPAKDRAQAPPPVPDPAPADEPLLEEPSADPAPRPRTRPGRRWLVAAVVTAIAAGIGIGAFTTDRWRGSDDEKTTPPSISNAGQGSTKAPLTVVTRPYAWQEDPCARGYLLNRPADQVPPPPAEPDAEGWVRSLGAVAAGEQLIEVTVQGAGAETVVLQGLHVRIVNRGIPLDWTTFNMADGCGGNASSASLAIDLDRSQPSTHPTSGQHDFPFKVSQSDPEVLYVTGRTAEHDVTWYADLEWSSAGRHGLLRIDDHGRPFHTSATTGHKLYTYPIGDNAWWLNPL